MPPPDKSLTDTLHELEVALAHTALALTHALNYEDAPLNQQASALGVLVDRLLKLRGLHTPDDNAPVIPVMFQDADGSLHDSPFWRRGEFADAQEHPQDD